VLIDFINSQLLSFDINNFNFNFFFNISIAKIILLNLFLGRSNINLLKVFYIAIFVVLRPNSPTCS
jgi:hypothetical protein